MTYKDNIDWDAIIRVVLLHASMSFFDILVLIRVWQVPYGLHIVII